MMAPAGTPPPVIDRLSAEVERAMATPAVRERFASIGVEADVRKGAPFAAYLKEQSDKFREVIQENNIRLD